MSLFLRSSLNPLLGPDPAQPWEAQAAFNGCVVNMGDKTMMVYRAISSEQVIDGHHVKPSSIGIAESTDGRHFTNRRQLLAPKYEWEKYGCEDPRITFLGGKYYIFYTAISSPQPDKNSIKCAVAISQDLVTIDERHLVTPFNAKAMSLFPQKIEDKYSVLLSVYTDQPPTAIALAQVEHLEQLWQPTFWEEWLKELPSQVVPLCRVNNDQVEVGAPPLLTEHGWLFFFSYIKHYFSDQKIFRIEAAVLDLKQPRQLIGRVENPCLLPTESYELVGDVATVVFPSGALITQAEGGPQIDLYYGAADTSCCVASAPLSEIWAQVETNAPVPIKAVRFPNNPLLLPDPDHDFESKAAFNPAAIQLAGQTYLLYRCLSSKNVSTVGLAISRDGLYIDERLTEPIYWPRTAQEMQGSPLENCGCEDPRITQMGDQLYLCYTAYDGVLPRLAMSQISVADFLAREWQNWSLPKIISAPNVGDKDGCLFPGKVRDHYAFFHRLEPNIVLDLVPSLEFPAGAFLGSTTVIKPSPNSWDDVKIGINAPPIQTPAGWLVLYHGISQVDHFYRLGAMLIGLECGDLLARTKYPLLEPVTEYEKVGIVNNVVFPCGAVVKEDTLFIYYGGADQCVGGATVSLSGLVGYLVRTEQKKYLTKHAPV